MRIAVIGSRGIPQIQGGVETHCEELYSRIAQTGCEVMLFRRSSYVLENNKIASYKGIALKDIRASKSGFGAFWYALKSVVYAKRWNADIVHIHAIGPALFVPFAQLLGMKTVVTHHGFDYTRPKWGWFAKRVLKLGERFSVGADELIVISGEINQHISQKFGRTNAHLIYNGVNLPLQTTHIDYLQSLNLKPQKYVFTLGRFVEEKGFDKLIEIFASVAGAKDFRLVIAGREDYPSVYATRLEQLAKQHGVVLTGFVQGEELNELFSHARLFVLPSSHEGLPISLLEAMSYGLNILASDITANIELKLPSSCYFRCGNWGEFAEKIGEKLTENKKTEYDLSDYNWDTIAQRTLEIYQKQVNKYLVNETSVAN